MPGMTSPLTRRGHLPRGTFRALSKNLTAASPVRAWMLWRSTPGASMQAWGNSFFPSSLHSLTKPEPDQKLLIQSKYEQNEDGGS